MEAGLVWEVFDEGLCGSQTWLSSEDL